MGEMEGTLSLETDGDRVQAQAHAQVQGIAAARGAAWSRRELTERTGRRSDLAGKSFDQGRRGRRGGGEGEQVGERMFVGVVNRWKPLPLSLSKLHPRAGDTLEILVSGEGSRTAP